MRLFKFHNRYALRILCSFRQNRSCVNKKHSTAWRANNQFSIFFNVYCLRKRWFIWISVNKLLSVSLCSIRCHINLCKLTVIKHKNHISRIFAHNSSVNHLFTLCHFKLTRNILTENRSFCISKIINFCFIHLALICKEKKFILIWTFDFRKKWIALFNFLLAAHTKISCFYFLKISVFSNK